MNKILLLLIPAFIYAESLKELINGALIHNDLIIAKHLNENSKSKELSAQKSSYFPTVNLGAFYKRDDAPNPLQPRDTYSGFAKFNLNIYNGGRTSANIKSAKNSLISSKYDKQATKKSITLSITKYFFNIKSLQALLKAKIEEQKSLQAQLNRVKQFYAVQLATKDDVDRLQASFDTNIYDMQSIKFQILSMKKLLQLQTGLKISSLDNSTFKKEKLNNYRLLDSTKSILFKEKAIKESSNKIDSFYYPNINLEDKYALYAYDKENPEAKLFGASPLNKQNTLLLTLNFVLFDYAQLKKEKEAVLLKAQELGSNIIYKNKEQKIQYELAKARIRTNKLKIKSAKSALKAATSAYKTIEQKYNAGIVDYVVYLDALTKKTDAKSLYESSLNDLEIAYATYYYYSGNKIEDYLQ